VDTGAGLPPPGEVGARAQLLTCPIQGTARIWPLDLYQSQAMAQGLMERMARWVSFFTQKAA
jgi:hypothetical protein